MYQPIVRRIAVPRTDLSRIVPRGLIARYFVAHSLVIRTALWLVLSGVIMGLAPLVLSAAETPVSLPHKAANLQDMLRSLVELNVRVPVESRSGEQLGTLRSGRGIVIDAEGVILTVGYLVLEAMEVEIVTHDGRKFGGFVIGYDVQNGFGLVRSNRPLNLPPIPLGDSKVLQSNDPVLMITNGEDPIQPVVVVARRKFVGEWEYMLEDAIYTTPPRANFGGAALLNRNYELVGIGTLLLDQVLEGGLRLPGNLFVPTQHLQGTMLGLLQQKPTLRKSRPWLGVNLTQQFGRIVITRVTGGGPAEQAGLSAGDIILSVGTKRVETMEQFYQQLWGLGDAGIVVPITLLKGNLMTQREVTSKNHYRFYQMQQHY